MRVWGSLCFLDGSIRHSWYRALTTSTASISRTWGNQPHRNDGRVEKLKELGLWCHHWATPPAPDLLLLEVLFCERNNSLIVQATSGWIFFGCIQVKCQSLNPTEVVPHIMSYTHCNLQRVNESRPDMWLQISCLKFRCTFPIRLDCPRKFRRRFVVVCQLLE